MGGKPVGYLQPQPRSCTRGFREQHQLGVRTGFEPATYGFQIRRSNQSATLPPFVEWPRQAKARRTVNCTERQKLHVHVSKEEFDQVNEVKCSETCRLNSQ